METVSGIDKKIVGYLEHLNIKQKKAVLNVVKTFAEEQPSDIWEDPAFIKTLDRRTKELETGKVKGYSWEEVKQKARNAVKSKK